MDFLLTAIAFVVIFSVLVLVHEWGHFYMARKNGIKVEEFGFGIPPRIWGVKKGDTLYSINLIPFGGFVRLLGEDSRDPKVNKNPKSFSNKSLWVRTKVVLAGVVMNFILAFVLLTIGFTFGIQPLILNGDDVINRIQDGTIQTQPGIVVKDVKVGGSAQIAGLQAGDLLISIDGHAIVAQDQVDAAMKGKKTALELDILHGDEKKSLHLVTQHGGDFGFSLYELMFLPRLQIVGNLVESPYNGDLQSDDVILRVDGRNIYSLNDLEAVVQTSAGKDMVDWEFLRGSQVKKFSTNFPFSIPVVISNVFPDSPAEKAGLKAGDIVESINDEFVHNPQDVPAMNLKFANKPVTYAILHQDLSGISRKVTLVPDEKGLIGVQLEVAHFFYNIPFNVFNRNIATSVLKVHDVRYPFWIAPIRALEESWRLTGVTVDTFVNLATSFFTRLSIPEGVAGPVGIAQLTFVFVQEGFLSLLRFMALLSLSLAIINVLPFPALDGGRFLFIAIEIVTGKKLSGKYEGLIHLVGFIFLMLLILAVTYSDIVRIFF